MVFRLALFQKRARIDTEPLLPEEVKPSSVEEAALVVTSPATLNTPAGTSHLHSTLTLAPAPAPAPTLSPQENTERPPQSNRNYLETILVLKNAFEALDASGDFEFLNADSTCESRKALDGYFIQFKTFVNLSIDQQSSDLEHTIEKFFKKNYNNIAIFAALVGCEAAMDVLLRPEFKPHQLNALRNTPIHVAAQFGHINIVKLLIKRNVVTSQGDDLGRPPICIAAEKGHKEIVQLLLDTNAYNNQYSETEKNDSHLGHALIRASENGHTDIVELLLNKFKEQNIEITEHFGISSLCQAAVKGHIEIAKKLIEVIKVSKIDINYSHECRYTPLGFAVANNHQEIVQLLLDAGADINKKSKNGYFSVLGAAARKGKIEMVKFLLAKGADIYINPEDGEDALYLAVSNGHLKIVKLLLARGDINKRNDQQKSLLYAAFILKRIDIGQFLLKHDPQLGSKGKAQAINKKDFSKWIKNLNLEHPNKKWSWFRL